MLEQENLRFKTDFRIRKITELVEVEYRGQENGHHGQLMVSKIGREYGLNDDNDHFFECGEFTTDENNNDELHGHGVCIFEEYLSMGKFEHADLNGAGRHIYHDGRILEGVFKNDELNGLGKYIL